MTRLLAAAAGGLALFLVAVRTDTGGAELLRLLVFGAALGAIVATDLAEHRVPNRIVLPAIVACAALLCFDAVPFDELFGGLAFVAAMFALSALAPASFGMGDVKLTLLFVLGLGGLATEALVLGVLLAAAFGATLLLRHGRAAAARSLPLAPFLASGAAIAGLS